jgi:hypothetical protein
LSSPNPAANWPWSEELDALNAAWEHHTLLLENERVRVIMTHIPAGQKTQVHTHRWPSVITFLQWSDFVRRDANDCEMLDTRTLAAQPEPQTAVWSLPFAPHSVENVGNTELRTISVELKEERRG